MKQYIISIFTIFSFYIINAYVAYAIPCTSPAFPAGCTNPTTGGGTPLAGGGSGGGVAIEIKNPIGETNIATLITKLLEFLIQIGAIAVVLAIVWAGFLFVVAQGNPAKINQAKEALKWSVIGGAILLGAQLIAKMIQSTLQELS